MNSLALTLVLTSALVHATWNLLAKKSAGGRLFVWSFTTLSSAFLVPSAIVLLVVKQHAIDFHSGCFIAGTALIHLVYFMLLQRGYQTGDLSLVYPLARGLGPALATIGAILLLDERPSALALTGLVLVLLGVILLTARRTSDPLRHPRIAITYGVLTGVSIAIYTVWDKYTVSTLNVPPLVLEAFAGLGISLMLTPYALKRWDDVKQMWRTARMEIVGVAFLAPLSYILVLTAMSFTPLSYVAPSREISILFAAVLGARFLGEGHTVRRLVAAGTMVAGVVSLALG